VDDDGNYHILDMNSSRIVVFNPDGTYSHTIGRLGSGPGDLSYPISLWYRNGLLYVSDSSPLRLTRFNPDGSLVDVTTRYEITSAGIVPEIDLTEEGHILLYLRDYQKEDRLRSVALKVVVLSSRDDTLAVLATSTPQAIDPLHVRPGVRSHPILIHYSSYPNAIYRPGKGILLASGMEPVLRWYDLRGRPVQEVFLNLPEEIPSATDRRMIEESYDRLLETAPLRMDERAGTYSRDEIQLQRDNISFPDHKAYWSSIFVDREGYYWLRLSSSQLSGPRENEPVGFRVLDPDGKYLGDTWTPPVIGAMPGDGYLMALVLDERTGERIPTVFRMRSAIEGLIYPVPPGSP